MTAERGASRGRWTSLAVLCVGGLFLLAGCVEGNVNREPALEVDRPTDPDEDCPEVEVLRETHGFGPKLFPIVDHGTMWPIDLRSGEAVKISVYWGGSHGGGAGMGLPDLEMVDPSDALLLEKEDYSINDHTVAVETNGTHEITVEHTALTKGATWIVEINWYPDIECA